MANPIIDINGSDQIHTDYLRFTLAMEKELLNDYKPALASLEKRYGEESGKAKVLGSLLGVSKDYLLNLVATNDTFFVSRWWKKCDQMPVIVRDKFIVDQLAHLRFFFFLKMVAMVETQLRIITRAIDPSNPGTKEFYKIYSELLAKLNLQAQYNQAYDIARLIRNTIHNMGVHTSASVSVQFSGKTYQFTQWKQIDFLSDRLNLDLQDELIKSVVDITSTKAFQNSTL